MTQAEFLEFIDTHCIMTKRGGRTFVDWSAGEIAAALAVKPGEIATIAGRLEIILAPAPSRSERLAAIERGVKVLEAKIARLERERGRHD